MKRQSIKLDRIKLLKLWVASCFSCFVFVSPHETIEATKSVATHIGTFEGSATFRTTSQNGVNPGLFVEVMDEDGNLAQYESEEGMITIPNTKEGAYVTQAKLLGKTKYLDEDTGEVLDTWEEGRNLRLESSENPGLITTGKNLYSRQVNFTPSQVDNRPTLLMKGNEVLWENEYNVPGQVVFSIQSINQGSVNPGWGLRLSYVYTDGSRVYAPYLNAIGNTTIFKSDPNKTLDYVILDNPFVVNNFHIFEDTIQIEYGSEATPYISPQLSAIVVDEDVVLRGIGGVRDELNLITGEVTKQIEELVLDGSEHWNKTGDSLQPTNPDFVNFFYSNPTVKVYGVMKANSIPVRDAGIPSPNISWFSIGTHSTENHLRLCIERTKASTVNELKAWLSSYPIQTQYQLARSLSEKVNVSSTYFFKPINKDSIQVTGTITPLVGSVIVPTTPVSFVLDPNQEARQQFIAPEFSVSNEVNAPIRLTLNRFEQTTNVLNDVLPEKYDNWEGLNKKESKDIALALVPKMSDGWVSLNEGPRYVAETSNTDLGVVKAKSSVDFTFSACHGQAFEETLSPSYRLGFVFEFMN